MEGMGTEGEEASSQCERISMGSFLRGTGHMLKMDLVAVWWGRDGGWGAESHYLFD